MALKLGELEVDITGDTSGLKQAEASVKKSSTRMNAVLKKTEDQAKRNTKALGGFGRKAGQAGIQIQQFVGQVQGGQSAMLALSQQSADLGFVLGAPLLGAIAGIAATVVGSLLPALFNSKDATEELEESLKRLDDVAIETADGVEVLSKKLVELAQKSQQAAKAEIQSGILSAMNAIKVAAKETDSVLTDLFGSNLKSTGTDALFFKDTINQVSESLKITKEETGGIVGAFRLFKSEMSTENLENLQSVLDGLAVTYGAAAPKVVELAEQIRAFSMKAVSAKERMDFLKTALVDLDTAITDTKKATAEGSDGIEKYIKALSDQVGALGLSGIALAEYEAGVLGATGEDKEQIVALREKIRLFKEAQSAANDEQKAREASQKNLDKLKSGGLSEEGKIEEDYKTSLDTLIDSLLLEQLTNAEFDELAIQAHKDRNDKLLELDKRRQTEQAQLNVQALSNLASFHSSVNELIKASGKEGTAAAKAAFLAGKAIQVAQIIASTEVAAAQASAFVSGAGPAAWLASSTGIRAIGYANAGIVAGLSIGEAFENGGIVGGNSTTGDKVPARVNSGEMILNKRQQSKLFGMANGAGQGTSSGQPSINIINNGAPIEVESMSVSREEITMMISNGEKRINQSLASGRGSTAQSLQKGFRAERKL